MSGPATTSVSNNRPSVICCKAVNSVTVTEIPVQLEPMLTSPTSAMHCGVYGGWLGPLSAIQQFQLPLYFHPISTLFPLWTLTSTLFPLYFHSEIFASTLFPLYFHSISTLDFCFHSISKPFPSYYLPSSWTGNGWLGWKIDRAVYS